MAEVKNVNGKWYAKWLDSDEKWYELDKWLDGGIMSLYKEGLLGDDYDSLRNKLTNKYRAERLIYQLETGKGWATFHMRGVVYDTRHGYYGDTEEEQKKNLGDKYDVVKALIDLGSKGRKEWSKFEK